MKVFDLKLGFPNVFAIEREFDSRYTYDCALSMSKVFEFQVYDHADEWNPIVGVEFGWSVREDHAGIMFELNLFGKNVAIQVYDTRHVG